MNSLRDTIEQISTSSDRQLAWSFFVLYARAEYALKRCGFLKNKLTAEADWDRFARDTSIVPAVSKTAVAYLRAHPPRKQEQVGGVLRWSEPIQPGEGEVELVFVCRCISTIRNNLFHGGKFQDGPISEPARDRELLKFASDVVFALVDSSERVRGVFLEVLSEA